MLPIVRGNPRFTDVVLTSILLAVLTLVLLVFLLQQSHMKDVIAKHKLNAAEASRKTKKSQNTGDE